MPASCSVDEHNVIDSYTKDDSQESTALSLCLHLTRAHFFSSHAHSQRVHSAAASPLSTALYTKEREGVTRDNSIVYDFYTLATRWTVHAKNRQLSDLYVLIKSLVTLPSRDLGERLVRVTSKCCSLYTSTLTLVQCLHFCAMLDILLQAYIEGSVHP